MIHDRHGTAGGAFLVVAAVAGFARQMGGVSGRLGEAGSDAPRGPLRRAELAAAWMMPGKLGDAGRH